MNGKPLEEVITLHTPQHLKTALNIGILRSTGPLHVGEYVNGIKLPAAKKNTLMVSILFEFF